MEKTHEKTCSHNLGSRLAWQVDCVVIGAGIAGVTSARAMVEAGRRFGHLNLWVTFEYSSEWSQGCADSGPLRNSWWAKTSANLSEPANLCQPMRSVMKWGFGHTMPISFLEWTHLKLDTAAWNWDFHQQLADWKIGRFAFAVALTCCTPLIVLNL